MTRNGELRRLIRLYSYRGTAGAKTLGRALPVPSTRIKYGDPDPKEKRACWNTCMLIPEHLFLEHEQMVDPRAIGYGSELGPPTGYGTKRRDAGNGSLTPEQYLQLEKDPLGQLL